MNKNLSFANIENFSFTVESNELFNQYTNVKISEHFDSNYILLMFNPTLLEFKIMEQLHKDYQTSIGQNHLKFCWPEDNGIYLDVLEYLNKQAFKLGMQELMVLDPSNFTAVKINNSVQIEIVTPATLDHFLKINYEEDLKLSRDFADHKQKLYRYQFKQPHVQFVIAYDDLQSVASLVLISSTECLEVDNVLTSSPFRDKRIATTMLRHVITDLNPDKIPVILVVDAEDTPREFYLKCGFEIKSSQISAEKKIL